MNPEGTFGGPMSHGVVNIDRGGRGHTDSSGAVKLKEGWDIVRHRDTECTVNTIMV